jgi:hypothetical protein
VKQVSQATNADEGSLVTTHCFISAVDNIIPTVIVFVHVHFKQFMNKNAPPGTLGVVTRTGWMTSGSSVDVTKHFIKHTTTSKENPSLVLLAHHKSSLPIATTDLAKELELQC